MHNVVMPLTLFSKICLILGKESKMPECCANKVQTKMICEIGFTRMCVIAFENRVNAALNAGYEINESMFSVSWRWGRFLCIAVMHKYPPDPVEKP